MISSIGDPTGALWLKPLHNWFPVNRDTTEPNSGYLACDVKQTVSVRRALRLNYQLLQFSKCQYREFFV